MSCIYDIKQEACTESQDHESQIPFGILARMFYTWTKQVMNWTLKVEIKLLRHF